MNRKVNKHGVIYIKIEDNKYYVEAYIEGDIVSDYIINPTFEETPLDIFNLTKNKLIKMNVGVGITVLITLPVASIE